MTSEILQMLKKIETHLKTTKTEDSIIDTYLTEYLLIRLYAECENELKEAVSTRVSKVNDHEIKSFILTGYNIKVHRVDGLKSNILKRFSDKYPTEFDKKIMGKTEVQDFANMITNRHILAHGNRNGVQLARRSMPKLISSVEFINKAFSDTLNR